MFDSPCFDIVDISVNVPNSILPPPSEILGQDTLEGRLIPLLKEPPPPL